MLFGCGRGLGMAAVEEGGKWAWGVSVSVCGGGGAILFSTNACIGRQGSTPSNRRRGCTRAKISTTDRSVVGMVEVWRGATVFFIGSRTYPRPMTKMRPCGRAASSPRNFPNLAKVKDIALCPCAVLRCAGRGQRRAARGGGGGGGGPKQRTGGSTRTNPIQPPLKKHPSGEDSFRVLP
jgi:hypothetical protein